MRNLQSLIVMRIIMSYPGDTIELSTDRLVLRTIDETFAARCLDYVERNREFFSAWNPLVDASFYTLEFQAQKLRADRDLLAQDRVLRLWLFHKEDIAH